MSPFPEENALSPPFAITKKPEVKADLEQMFLLIEGILPFEACLYYQVLPLSIEGSSLNLGMVNPDDVTASDYVRRLVSYINCSIVSRPIASDWHREILSKFLSHSAKSRQAAQASQDKVHSTPHTFEEQPTLVVGSPTEIIEHPHTASIKQQTEGLISPEPGPALEIQTASPEESEENSLSEPQPQETSIVAVNSDAPAPQAPLTIALAQEGEATIDSKPPPPEETQVRQTLPEENLSNFEAHQANPRELTQALLKRVITQEGIGRLYLERQSASCRILWSKDGVVQSVVDDISPQILQGVINEFKQIMSLPLTPVRKPQQIEIERIHNQKRILLRFRVMPGEHSEEATLQILRGAALTFYQQQQIDNIGRDALNIAQNLQHRIDELRSQAQRTLEAQDTKQKTLPAIVDMLKQMKQQIEDIMKSSDQP